MSQLFEFSPDRRQTHSIKWTLYPQDVLPLWVADMDFPAPQPVHAALQRALAHGVLGYEFPTRQLRETVAARMARIHNWQVEPDWVLATPGVIAGFNAAAHAACQPGDGILIQTPAYPPFLSVHENVGLIRQLAPLAPTVTGNLIHYAVDWEAFQGALHSGGARTKLFLLCSPHNPTGRVFTRAELARIAKICLENKITICADEIHNEHILDGSPHTPLAALSPEIAAHTITLVAPSKTFNVPGLFCGFAIIPDAGLRAKYKKVTKRLIMHVSSLSLIAAEAAFGGACDDWLSELRLTLKAHRDLILQKAAHHLPGIRLTAPQATYMTWLDCANLVESGRIHGAPKQFFLEKAKVALTDGADFGPGYERFVRLVFGCPNGTLSEALQRMHRALTQP